MSKPRTPRFSRLADRMRTTAWDDRGAAIAVVALLGTALVLIAGVIVARQYNEFQAGSSDQGWEEALHVAESGVDEMLYELDQDPDYIQDEDLVVTDTLDTRDDIVVAAENLVARKASALIDTPDGEVVVFEQDGADGTLYAVAFSPSMDAEHRLVRVLETEYHVTPGEPWSFPQGAVASEGDVVMTGNASTLTIPSPPHEASIHTNNNYSGTGNSVVDGDISASGTITGGQAAGDIIPGAPPVDFPDQGAVDGWQQSLIAEAQAGGTRGPISTSTVINGSIYVNGGISLSSTRTLVLNGPGVVYVSGTISLSGKAKIINNGVVLASAGAISMSGQSAYEVGGDPTQASLVTFSTSTQALQLTGQGSGSAQGIVYAPNGGAKLTGNGTFTGAILAGGPGGVRITGNGTLLYPEGLLDAATGLPPTPGGVELDAEREITNLRTTES